MLSLLFKFSASIISQTFLPIPDTLSGPQINLNIADSTTQIFPGFNTATIAYNGEMHGPTIILNKGQEVNLNVTNQLQDTTTTHWHGLHVSPVNDGSPHNLILEGTMWSPSFTVMDNAATYWYHPHLHGKTMKQVIKGAAGLIIVKDPVESAIDLPRNYGVDDIPVITRFVTIDNNTKQFVMDDELDNTVLVNGVLSPQVNVPAQVVRLRLLNASSHRFFDFGVSDNRTFYQITSDDGLLNAPIGMTRLTLGSGERAEILIDFAGQEGEVFYLKQYGSDLPAGYPGGPPDQMGMMDLGPLDNVDFNLLQFNVVEQTSNPVTTIPSVMTENIPWSSMGASSMNFQIQGSPMMSMTNFTINGLEYDEEVINFNKQLNDVMIWNITNQSMMPHPFHIHGNHFFILEVNGEQPSENLLGRKDVAVVPPNGGSVKLITKYEDFSDPEMPYMYHCHILSHEDNGMMGQFIIGDNSIGVNSQEKFGENVVAFPNPSSDFWTIDGESSSEKIHYKIYDALGRTIEQSQAPVSNGHFVIKVDAGNYLSGIYYLELQQSRNQQPVKLIKQ